MKNGAYKQELISSDEEDHLGCWCGGGSSLFGLGGMGLLSLYVFCGCSCISRLLGGSAFLWRSLAGSSFGLVAIRGSPEGEVVTEQLHDQGAITVRLFRQRVELRNGIVKGLLGEMACAVGGVEDLVVEDREVEGKSKTDGVSWGELGLGNVGSTL